MEFSSYIWGAERDGSSAYRSKMAAFDFDWTLVKPKGNRKFPRSVGDWEWLFPSVQEKLRALHHDGYMIVLFTNQSKNWKFSQIQEVTVALQLGGPVHVYAAFSKEHHYKPNPFMFHQLELNSSVPIDKEQSFFVGDALGRPDDFSDSDRRFAENIGIRWMSPEEFFCGDSTTTVATEEEEETAIDKLQIQPSEEREIIVMMGYPGAGKSTVANQLVSDYVDKYVCIHGDEHKTSKKMISVASQEPQKSIIFDATNSNKAKRQEYIAFAQKQNIRVIRCVHVDTVQAIAYARNLAREGKPVPRIAYSVYAKHFEPPSVDEGFTEIITL